MLPPTTRPLRQQEQRATEATLTVNMFFDVLDDCPWRLVGPEPPRSPLLRPMSNIKKEEEEPGLRITYRRVIVGKA